MLINQLQSSRSWIYYPRFPCSSQNRLRRRKLLQLQCCWSHSSVAHFCFYLGHCGANALHTQDIMVSLIPSNAAGTKSFETGTEYIKEESIDLSSNTWKDSQPASRLKKVCHTDFFIGSLPAYFLIRLTCLNSSSWTRMVQNIFQHLFGAFGATDLHFACLSSSMNKPQPLRLVVSIPPLLKDVKWSLSRLMYLLNVQLERNIATIFIPRCRELEILHGTI